MALPLDQRGAGEAVVLLHAGIADRTMWTEHLTPVAATGRRVIAVDLPGFGEAPFGPGPLAHWLNVLGTMDELAIERAALIGASFGGAVALRVAALYTDRVSSLVLSSSPTAPEPEPSPTLLAAWEAEEAALERRDVEAAVEAVLEAWLPQDAPSRLRERVVAMQRRNFALQLSEPEPEQAPDPLERDPELLRRIQCPVLLLAGAEDMVDFKAAALDLEERLPRANRIVIPAVAHLAPLEAPDVFLRHVFDALS